MKKKLTSSLGLVLVFCLSAAAMRPAADPPAVRHPLWKVSGEHNTVYLVGSVHCLKITDYPLPPVIQHAFSNAPIAVFETDLGKLQALRNNSNLRTNLFYHQAKACEES